MISKYTKYFYLFHRQSIAIIFLFFLIAVSLNAEWLYPIPGWLDEWYYVAYAFNFGNPEFLKYYYKVSRIPWILANIIYFNVFELSIAQIFLQITCILSAVYLVFAAARRLCNLDAATIAAALLIAYPFFQGSGGASYHNTMAGLLYAATFLVTTIAARSAQPSWPALAAGFFFAATVHTNISFVNLSSILAIHFIVCRKIEFDYLPLLDILRVVLLGLAGALVATILLGLVSLAFGRDFLFFLPQLDLATSFVADNSKQLTWWRSWCDGWISHAWYMGPLVATAIASFVSINFARIRRDRDSLMSVSLCGQYLLLFIMWVIWQTLGQTALNIEYFAYPLVIPMVLAIAGVIGIFARPNPRHAWTSALTLCAAAFIPLWLAWDLPTQFYARLGWTQFVIGLVGFAVGLAIVMLSGRYRPGLMISAFIFGLTCFTGAYHNRVATPCNYRSDAFHAIVRAHHHIIDTGVRADNTYVWFDNKEVIENQECGNTKIAPVGFSLTSTGFRYLENPWPRKSIEDLDIENLKAVAANNPLFVFVTNDDRNLQRLIDRLKEANIDTFVDETVRIKHGSVHFGLNLLRLKQPVVGNAE